MDSINTFLKQFINVSSGRRQKDTPELAHTKVLFNLDVAKTGTPSQRRNARQNLRRLLAKHPQIMTLIGGAK